MESQTTHVVHFIFIFNVHMHVDYLKYSKRHHYFEIPKVQEVSSKFYSTLYIHIFVYMNTEILDYPGLYHIYCQPCFMRKSVV